MLCKGKLHIEFVGENSKGDDPSAMDTFVQKLRAAVNVRFPSSKKPKIVFTDKGRGFYRMNNSKITPEYDAALRKYGFKPSLGRMLQSSQEIFKKRCSTKLQFLGCVLDSARQFRNALGKSLTMHTPSA